MSDRDIQDLEEQVQEWSANSTEAFTIALRQGDKTLASFNPDYTYAIFGDEESIFGYRDLEIILSFNAHDLEPHLQLIHDGKFPDQGDVKASDVEGALADFLPSYALTDLSAPASTTQKASSRAADFQPPGSKLHTYNDADGDTFEIWASSLADLRALAMIKNMQILAPLMIDGGRTLELDEPWIINRWKLFLLYKILSKPGPTRSKYAIAGYATSYRIFTLPDRDASSHDDDSSTTRFSASLTDADLESLAQNFPADSTLTLQTLRSRERLSQFIIFPPFQRSGHGTHLYNTIYADLTTPPNICELTVEDPNEDFDILRDICDMTRLRRTSPDFASLSVSSDISSSKLRPEAAIPNNLLLSETTLSALKAASKIAPRQFSRLVEMQTLSRIPRANRSTGTSRITRRQNSTNPHDKAYYFWRLYTKQRLYQFNRDVLLQLDDRVERVEKLEQALGALQEDYERILEAVDARSSDQVVKNGHSGKRARSGADADGPVQTKRARRVIDDDDEAEEDARPVERDTDDGIDITDVQ